MRLRQSLAALAVLLITTLAAWTQEAATPDYTAWAVTVARAELVIEAERASDPAFETLREQLVEWRTQFQDATSLNASRIQILRAQLEALGPAPGEGGSEPDEIAIQRDDLTARLAEAESPGRRAEAELLLARGLIGQIDTLLAQRQAGALLTLGPAPLNPANWPGAIEAVYDWARALAAENLRLWSSPLYRAEFNDNLPVVVIYLIIGLVLLLRGWQWVGRLMRGPIAMEATSAMARLSMFFLSIAQHAAPILGILALVKAIEASSFVGVRGAVILDATPVLAVLAIGALWIGRQVFPSRETAAQPLNLPDYVRRRGRFTAAGLGFLIGAGQLIAQVADFEAFSVSERLVVFFPIVVLIGLSLARLGRFVLIHVRNQTIEGEPLPLRARILFYLGWVIVVIGLAGPVLVSVGYFTAGASFLFPAAISLGLLAILGVLRRQVANLYGVLTGHEDTQDEALTPMLIGFVLTILSIPIFALIWGLRQAQLFDLWRQLIDGFDIGGITISPRNFLAFALVFAAGYTITRLVQSTLRNSVMPKTRLDAGGRNAVVTGTGYLGIFLAALVAITMAGIDLSSIAIVAGALSVGIGFGLQAVVSNFVSGIILLIERPIKEGDWIEVGTTMGYVREISVRATRIETFDRSDVIVPNADLISGVVTNMTHHNATGRVIVPVGVAYGSDTRKVEAILREVAEAHPMVLLSPPPTIVFQGFGADSLDFEIRAILRDVNWVLSVKSDMNHEIARRFTDAEIEIPYAQRDIWFRNPEALAGFSAPGMTMREADTGPRQTDGESE